MVYAHELSSSLEDYLETILHLQAQKAVARARDIGSHLRVNRSSVTTALQALSKRGLINYAPYEVITLTEDGQRVARDVARRHEIMRQFLTRVLRVEEPEASTVACRLEHALSGVTLQRLADFMDFVNRCPSGMLEWSLAEGFRCSRPSEQVCDKCSQSLRRKGD